MFSVLRFSRKLPPSLKWTILESVGFSVTPICGSDVPAEIMPVIDPADYDANTVFCCEKPVQANPQTLVSVVIPVNNVSAYLDRCLNSVTKQTYKELEILLIDDGSTDGSGQLCDQWAARDTRITVIHRENGGLSAARNTGLSAAHGNYICFIDSDDYIHRDMIRRMLDEATSENVDMVVCGFAAGNDSVQKQRYESQTHTSCSGVDAASLFLSGHSAGIAVWNKLYRSSLKPYLEFAESHVYEGKVPLFRAALHSRQVRFLPDRLYYYTLRSDSITQTITLSNEKDRIHSVHQLEQVIRDLAPQLMPEYLGFKVKAYTLTWLRLQYCEDNAAEEYARSLHAYIRAHRKEVCGSQTTQNLAVRLAACAPHICRRVYHLIYRRQ